ncbi:MAG: hypothetical protein LBE34_03255 [Flavobacteriaceae bacterium]|jgi:hypothetical protein|nr:hypothetical protein [Flavobacteriaceae bacterium]
MISFNKETKQIHITDNYKGRLTSSRIMSSLILLMAAIRIYMINWDGVNEMDYIFIIVAAVFLYLVYKNFLVNTAIDTIEKYDIKYVKMPKAMGVKVTIKLNNRKIREVYGYKTPESKMKLRKMLEDAKITVL